MSLRLSNLRRSQRTWVAASLIYFFVVLAMVVAYIPTEGRICAVWADEVEFIFMSAGKDDHPIRLLAAERGQVGDVTFARDAMLLANAVFDKDMAASKAASENEARIGAAPKGIAYYARLKAADEAIALAKLNWESALIYANTHDSVDASLAESQAHRRLRGMEKHREWLDSEMPKAMKYYRDAWFASQALIGVELQVIKDLSYLRERHNAELAALPEAQFLSAAVGLLAWVLPQAALYVILHLFQWVRREPSHPG